MTKFKIVGVKISENSVTTHEIDELFEDRGSAHLFVTTNYPWDMVDIPGTDKHSTSLRFHHNDDIFDAFQIHEVEVGE